MRGEDSQSLKACAWTMQVKVLKGQGEDDEQRELLSRKAGAFSSAPPRVSIQGCIMLLHPPPPPASCIVSMRGMFDMVRLQPLFNMARLPEAKHKYAHSAAFQASMRYNSPLTATLPSLASTISSPSMNIAPPAITHTQWNERKAPMMHLLPAPRARRVTRKRNVPYAVI